MARIEQQKIDEYNESALEEYDFYLYCVVEEFRMYWPENRPKPTIGWVNYVAGDLGSRLRELMFENFRAIGEGHDVDLTEFDMLLSKISKSLRSKRLVHNPEKRAELKEKNLKTVLDWLRMEPYSTVDVMALVLRRSEAGTRRILNTFVKEGWLIRDEIEWPGATRKKHRFGISSKGLYARMDEGAVEPPPSRTFKRNRLKASGAPHVLNGQLARLYYERIDNLGVYRRYRQDRDLPYFQTQVKAENIYKWLTYPDMIIENSHYTDRHGRPQTIAVEIEQVDKGTKRYKSLIRAHLSNIKWGENELGLSTRYDRVVYLFENDKERNRYQAMFHKLMKKMYLCEDLENAMYRFEFGVYGDLVDRIRRLS